MPLLDHVGFKVTDLDRSVKFYGDVFGFEEVERREIGRGVMTASLKVGANVIFLQHRPDYKARNPEEISGIDHVAFSFDAAEWRQVTRRAREMGVSILRELPRVLGSTGWGPCQYILDPDGNEIEIKHQ